MRQIAALEILRQVWVQQFYQYEGQVRWREKGNLPAPIASQAEGIVAGGEMPDVSGLLGKK